MKNEPRSRAEEAVPKPGEVKKMSEEEKRALETSGEIEHAVGRRKEEIARTAQQAGQQPR
jgi:hypothetical protein